MFGDAFDDVATYQDAVPPDDYLRSQLGLPHFIALAAPRRDRRGRRRRPGGVRAASSNVIGARSTSTTWLSQRTPAERHCHRAHPGSRTCCEAAWRLRHLRPGGSGDAPAIALYESLGDEEDVHHFDIRVD
jgi:hypothetical protein